MSRLILWEIIGIVYCFVFLLIFVFITYCLICAIISFCCVIKEQKVG